MHRFFDLCEDKDCTRRLIEIEELIMLLPTKAEETLVVNIHGFNPSEVLTLLRIVHDSLMDEIARRDRDASRSGA